MKVSPSFDDKIINNFNPNKSVKNDKYLNSSIYNNSIDSIHNNSKIKNSSFYDINNNNHEYSEKTFNKYYTNYKKDNINYNVEKCIIKDINRTSIKSPKNKNSEIETSQILYECMNNVKKKLKIIENEKNCKREENENLVLNKKNGTECKTMKHYKIRKKLCLNSYYN